MNATTRTLHADPVTPQQVADHILNRTSTYNSLSRGEQQTVDTIINKSSTDQHGHRPAVTDPYVKQLPTGIMKGDTLYSIYITGHVDGFGSGFGWFVRGFFVSAFGIVLILTGSALYVYD